MLETTHRKQAALNDFRACRQVSRAAPELASEVSHGSPVPWCRIDAAAVGDALDDAFAADAGSAADSPSPSAASGDDLADALELIARRVRRGEFRVRGYRRGMSDAAALAAVLGGVLGLDA